MSESRPTPIRHLPSKGLNLYEDESTLEPNFCSVCQNCLVDTRAYTVRKGISATTYAQTAPVAAHTGSLAHFSDGTSATYLIDVTGTGTKLKKAGTTTWEELTLPEGQELSSSARGDFTQLSNCTFLASEGTKPLKITKDGEVHFAGPQGLGMKTLASWESDTGWSGGGANGTVTTETNGTMYVTGEGGVTLQYVNEHTFTYAGSLDLSEFNTSYSSPNTDFIGFYLHRHHKEAIQNITLTLTDSSSETAICHVAGTIPQDDDEYGFLDFNPSGTFRKEWSRDPSSFRTFYVLLRKSWFVLSDAEFDWSAVASVGLTVTPSGVGSNPCAITVNNLHLLASGPIPVTDGIYVSTFEGNEVWAKDSGNGTVVRSYKYAIEGVYSLSITDDGSGTVAEYTPDPVLNLESLGDGSTLAARDRLTVQITSVAASALASLGKVEVILTDDTAHTMTATFYVGAYGTAGDGELGAGRFSRSYSRPLVSGFVTYGGEATSFSEFDWDEVVSVRVKLTAPAGLTVYVDRLKIERGRYQKWLTTFTPGLIDVAADGAALDTLLTPFPKIKSLVNYTSEFLQHLRYKTAGYGWFQMPYYEKAERGKASLASLLIVAGPDEVEIAGAAASLFDETVEGFRVTHMFNQSLVGDGKDFTMYTTLSKSAVPIDDSDSFRIWTWISDHTKLERIKFRIYTGSDTEDLDDQNFFQIASGEPGYLTSTESYYEYIWDATTLMSSQFNKVAAARHLERTQDTGFLNMAFQSWSSLAQVNLMKQGTGGTDMAQLAALTGLTAGGTILEGYEHLLQPARSETTAYGNLGNQIQKTLSNENFKKASKALGIDFNITDVRDDDSDYKSGTTKVITWRRGDMLAADGGGALDWSKVTGYSIEVIPKPGETVQVAFDNWYIFKKGGLNGTYSYCCTFVDSLGIEGQASVCSPEIQAKNSDVFISGLPSVWPEGTQQLNIYRAGGTFPEFALVGTLGKSASGTIPTTFIDTKSDDEVGQLLLDDALDPPECKYLVRLGDRLAYLNVTKDIAGKSHPSQVYISTPYNPGRCRLGDIREFDPNDGTQITGGVYLDGVTVIFKDRSIWTLNPDDLTSHRRVSSIGCIARRSIAVKEGMVFFLSHDGPAVYNLHECSSEIGRPVRSLFDAVASQTYLRNAVGFIYREYYWLFYGQYNQDAVVLHLPTRTWVQASFKTGASTYAQVWGMFQRDSSSETYLVTPTAVYDFLTADTDAGQVITATITIALSGLDAGEIQKNLKALYLRTKKLTATNGSVGITPKTDLITGSEISITVDTTDYKTQVISPAIGTNGYTHSLTLSISGRLSISMLTSVLDILPLELQ